MDEIFSVFAIEAREQLEAMEAGLLQLEQGDRDPETINGVFRAAHTIKGASGVVEIHIIEKFTHVLENVLDKLRNGEIEVSGEMITALLQGCDHIGHLLTLVEQGQTEPDETLAATGDKIAATLRAFVSGEAGKPANGEASLPQATVPPVQRGGETVITDCWHISVRFGREVLRKGMEPLAFLRFLLNLGEADAFDVETLGEMVRHLTAKGVAVPPGFATTAGAYWRFVEANALREVTAGTLAVNQGMLGIMIEPGEDHTVDLGIDPEALPPVDWADLTGIPAAPGKGSNLI